MIFDIFLWFLIYQNPSFALGGNTRYAAMVDCGGSGSRGRIFVWLAQTPSPELPTKLEQLRDPKTGQVLTFRIKPGLSSVQADPHKAADYMRPMMEFFNQNVPRESQNETMVHFLATAGLRSLPLIKQEAILENLEKDFKLNYSNFAQIETRVISGTQEGAYQWLSVNSQTGRLLPFNSAAASVGIIEVGSGSVQVAYELGASLEHYYLHKLRAAPTVLSAYRRSLHRITYSKDQEKSTVPLVSVSFSQFGTEAARELQVRLMLQNKPTTHLGDPCLPVGAEELAASGEVTLVGTGNFGACHVLLKKVLVVTKQQISLGCDATSSDDCSMLLLGTPFVPFKHHRFLGLSDLYYTTSEMINASGPFHAPKIRLEAIKICSLPHKTLLAIYPEANRVDKTRTMMECFKLVWILTLLHLGFLMPHNSVGFVETVGELGGNEIEWTRGALIERLAAQSTAIYSSSSQLQTTKL